MMIEIDDSLAGSERRKQLILQPLHYAFAKFSNKCEVCKFLGISRRALTDIVKRHPELYKYKSTRPWYMKNWSDERIDNYFEANKQYLNPVTRKYYDAWRSYRSGGSSESASEYNGQNIRQDANI